MILTNWTLSLLIQRFNNVTWYRRSSSVSIEKDTSIYISHWMDCIHTILFLILQFRKLYQRRINSSHEHRKLLVSASRGPRCLVFSVDSVGLAFHALGMGKSDKYYEDSDHFS